MRIAIVNDVILAIEAMRRVVRAETGHQIAWVAHDGAEAVRLCARDRPDLILMDLIMPNMGGVEATRRIMAETPCAIVVVTADVTRNCAMVFEAMGAGALDAVNTPVIETSGEGAKALLAKIDTIHRLIGDDDGTKRFARVTREQRAARPRQCLVGIGASAGGPAALARLLGALPADFPAPVVIVQHVDAQFSGDLARWLDGQSPLRVRLAEEGDRPEAGTALLAGGDRHLAFSTPTRLSYTREPEDCFYRPSIDVFFKSAARHWPGEMVAVLLTGMGRDGAAGLRDLRTLGHLTIAQDAQTSAVYGMPKAAAELRAAAEILALDKIAPRLTNILTRQSADHA